MVPCRRVGRRGIGRAERGGGERGGMARAVAQACIGARAAALGGAREVGRRVDTCILGINRVRVKRRTRP